MKIHNKLKTLGCYEDIREAERKLSAPGNYAYRLLNPSEDSYVGVSVEPTPSFMLANIVSPKIDEAASYWASWGAVIDWNLENWGTEREATYSALVDVSPRHHVYRFETYRTAPHKAISLLSLLYPRLFITMDASYSSGRGASYSFKRGVSHREYTWPTPDTHKAFERIRGYATCPCLDTARTAMPPYVDCHRGPVHTSLAVKQMNLRSDGIDARSLPY
jgi:hypothetical protein